MKIIYNYITEISSDFDITLIFFIKKKKKYRYIIFQERLLFGRLGSKCYLNVTL